MKKIFILILINCIFFQLSFSQNVLVRQWDITLGGTGSDYLSDFKRTNDGGSIAAGYSSSGISGDKTQPTQGGNDYWIVKIDSLGNKVWDRDYGGTADDQLHCIIQTNDGGYLLGGQSSSGVGGNKSQPSWGSSDGWIVKVDGLGNQQWDKRYGGTKEDNITSMQQTSDGGYILGASSNSGISGDKSEPNRDTTLVTTDYWIIKIDALGNKIWDKRFGGAPTLSLYSGDDALYSVQQTNDGGYILAGWSRSDTSQDKTQPLWGVWQDYWILKTDSVGNRQWDKIIGGTHIDNLAAFLKTSDGGYLLGGASASGISGNKTHPLVTNYFDYWIVKIDSLGNIQWDKDFGGLGHTYLYSLKETNDGGYLLGGMSQSNAFGDKTENNMGTVQTWIIKTDGLGNKIWDKTALSNSVNNTNGLAFQSTDGCYVIANSAYGGGIGGDKSQPSQGLYDYWIIKYCEDTINVVLPSSNFQSSDSVFCSVPATCIDFYDQSQGNPTMWRWYFPGAIPNSSTFRNPFNICYYLPGTYPVTLISGNHAGYDTLSVFNMITVGSVSAAPVITIIGGDTLICSHASTYQWYYNGVPIVGATDSFYVATQPGTYFVDVIFNGCNQVSNIVIVPVSVNEITASNYSIILFPNPATSEIRIENAELRIKEIEVYDVVGVKCLIPTLSEGEGVRVDVSSLAKGIYFVTVRDEKGNRVTKKFVKM